MDDQIEPLREKDVVCLGHLKRVFTLLDSLKDAQAHRDKAGNRQLTFANYTKLSLLYVWNPLINSMRRLQEAVALGNVTKALNIQRFSLGSFCKAPRAFDPDQLHDVIQELAAANGLLINDPRLAKVQHAITLVDSTVLRALTRLAHAAVGTKARCSTSRNGRPVYGWRLHTQLDLKTFFPRGIERTGARNAGEQRENNVLRRHLEADRCYVCDGGYADQSLFDAIVDAQSSYVIRMREDSVFTVTEERPLNDEALAAGVVRDAVVNLQGEGRHPVRLITVQVEPHPRRTRKDPKKKSELILLATSLIDLPAELVALIYQYRYTVELFFRIYKQLLGLRHLISQREQGIDIQIYCTAIVCLLICIITGKKPNRSNQSMIGWYLIGLATEQELIAHLNKPDNTGVKLRAKEELFKKLGF